MDQENRYHILVVDDDEVDRRAVSRGLANSGLQVEIEEARDGAQAIDILKLITFDCAFLDYRLGPGSDGLEVLKQLRERGDNTPIIMMTGYGDERIAVELLKAGATDYLPKSTLTPDVLGRSVRNAVSLRHSEEQYRQAEQALREREANFRSIFATANDAIIVIDPTASQIVQANPQATDLLGYSTSELEKCSADIVFPEKLEELVQLAGQNNDGGPGQTVESLCRHKQGHDIQVEISASRLLLGGQSMILTLLRDITERKRLEKEREDALLNAIESRKLSSIGEMACGIAHEMNQPLQSFKLVLHNLTIKNDNGSLEPETLSQKMDKMMHLVDEMSSVITNLEGYASPDDEYGHYPLVEIIDSTLSIVGAQLKSADITVEVDIPQDLRLRCRRSAMTQVLLNLLTNARDAYLTQSRLPGTPRLITLSVKSDDSTQHIYVQDKAGGIPAAMRERVFEPFVSTKDAVKNIGMGLHIVRQIISEHGGEIRLHVKDNIGTCIELILPQPVKKSSSPSSSNETVLTELA